jgi:hypothetical protein
MALTHSLRTSSESTTNTKLRLAVSTSNGYAISFPLRSRSGSSWAIANRIWIEPDGCILFSSAVGCQKKNKENKKSSFHSH